MQGMVINQVEWDNISWIPKAYKKGFASFSQHKKPHIWFAAQTEYEKVFWTLGVGKLLFLSAEHARLCSVFTLPQFRGMGVARAITEKRERVARAKGAKKISTIADASLDYWSRWDYTRSSYQGNNQRLMEKEL
jgi:GNAT superfamily N-acetyltransferase